MAKKEGNHTSAATPHSSSPIYSTRTRHRLLRLTQSPPEDATAEQPEAADFARIIGFAAPIAQAAKQAAKALQSVLAEDRVPALLQLSEIAVKEDAVYVRDAAGSLLRVTDANGSEAALRQLSQFDTGKSAIFGLFFADEVRRELCFLPQSLVTGRGIIRLML